MFDITSFIQRAIVQSIPLLFGCTGETITEKSGNLNLGLPGVMYIGAISAVIGSFFYEQSLSDPSQINAVLAVLIPLLCCILGSLLMGLLYCFLTVTLRANQNVTGLAMTTFGVGVGNFFGGSLISLTGSPVPSISLSASSGIIGHTYAVIEGLHAGNLGGLFLWGFCGSVQGFYYAIGALFLGADSEPALLAVEDVPADGLSKDLLVAIGVKVVIGHLEGQTKVITVLVEALLAPFVGPGNEGAHLGGACNENAGLKADHCHIFLHRDIVTVLEIHIHLLAVTYLGGRF